MRLPEGLAFETAFLSLAEENRLLPRAFERDGDNATFDLPAVKSAAAIWLMAPDHPPLLGSFFEWEGATAAPGEATPLVKPGETFGITIQVANPSGKALEGAALRVRAIQGWAVECVEPLGAVPPHAIAEARYRVTVGGDSPEMRRARFVRFSFECRPNAMTELDEIGIFGKLTKALFLRDNPPNLL